MKETNTNLRMVGNNEVDPKQQQNQPDLERPRNHLELEQLVFHARSIAERRWTYWMKKGVKALSFYLDLHPAAWKVASGEAAILFYHKVERRALDVWGEPVLDVHEFEQHVAFLTRKYRPVSMSELIAGLRGQTRLPDRAVALTFDDGYRNNLHLVAPILARYGVPAMLFITTGLIDTDQWMWAYELEEIFSRFSPEEIRRACGDPVIARLCALDLAPRALMLACVEYLKGRPHSVMLDIVERLRASFLLPVNDENRFLSWDEVRELRSQGFEIGAHTVTHPILTQLPLAEVEQELRACRDTLEAELGVPPTVFSYPNGTTSPEVSALVGRYFEAAVTTRSGFCSRMNGLLELPRIGAPVHVSDLAFELAWNYFRFQGTRPGLVHREQ
ncbi:polysaccharide deacetylase family protein [Archangium lansingense]|uniref:polysaccharide deacetylase family protein n=1 Tax=Archangium lansingense TaxID=2995310 RepID=UPI003B81714E